MTEQLSGDSEQIVPGKAVDSLRYLTPDDRRVLMDKAVVTRYARGDLIIQEGSRRQKLHFLQRGFVSICRDHAGQAITVARLGDGDVFGEISFLENQGASASVVADDDIVEVAEIAGEDIHALLDSVPGLAARFYQSLAMTLSARLREASSQLPALNVEDVPQVNRFHATRTGLSAGCDIPPTLVQSVEQFKTEMMVADRAMRDKKMSAADAQSVVGKACSGMEDSLRSHVEREQHLEKMIGAYVFRETFPLFMLSRMADRAFTKPRGYAGDYSTIELMYCDDPQGDGRLGKYVDRWWLDLQTARAMKNRRPFLREQIDAAAARWKGGRGGMPVTSLVSGPARELFDSFERAADREMKATCIDIDLEALEFASRLARERGLSERFTFAQDNVVRLSRGRGKVKIPPQWLIYSIGLIDYLQDDFVVALMNWSFDNLLGGGSVILGNLDASNPDKPYMDHVLEWVLIHRTPDELRELVSRSKFGMTPACVRTEKAGVNLFVSCTKP